eukprot:9484562-Pyramimonas_sp.AAC.1
MRGCPSARSRAPPPALASWPPGRTDTGSGCASGGATCSGTASCPPHAAPSSPAPWRSHAFLSDAFLQRLPKVA